MMKKLALAALAVAAAYAGQAEARGYAHAAPAPAGTLTCNLDPSLGFLIGSVRRVDCAYEHLDRHGRVVRESYVGTMKRAGFDIGLTGPQTISWTVSTAGGRNHRGMMSGAFNGSSAEATLVAGAGTQTLFGEQGNGMVLETVSQSGQVGFGLAFGETGLELMQVPNATFSSLR